MNDDQLHELMQRARQAQGRVDLSSHEYGFETRLGGRLDSLQHRGLGTLDLLWRAVAGCAALTGFLAVWFILAHAPTATEDDLTAFWDGGQASYDVEFLN